MHGSFGLRLGLFGSRVGPVVHFLTGFLRRKLIEITEFGRAKG
jgi:hypothetical protein